MANDDLCNAPSFDKSKKTLDSCSRKGSDPSIKRNGSDPSIKHLADLTQRLMKAGIYEDYLAYRENYNKWRKGKPQGARGEVSDVVKKASPNQADPYQFELWYPTPQKYHFFFTLSYWTAIFALEGCYCFVFGAMLPYISPRTAPLKIVCSWCPLIGATQYTLACYFSYLRLINIQDAERVYFFPSYKHWKVVLQRVQLETFLGTMVIFGASALYNVMLLVPVVPALSNLVAKEYLHVMSFIGGIGFFVGGLLEVSHTCFGEHRNTIAVFVALGNCSGGLMFFLAGSAELFSHHLEDFIEFVCLVGSVLYTVAAALLLVMWQGNSFGGTLLSELNQAICAGKIASIAVSKNSENDGLFLRLRRQVSPTLAERDDPPDMKSRMLDKDESPTATQEAQVKPKLRDVVSLWIYCWLFDCIAILLVIDALLPTEIGGRHLAKIGLTFIWMLGVKVILLILSSVTTVPNEQPYRFAMQLMWWLLMATTVVFTWDLICATPLGEWPASGSSVAMAVDSVTKAQAPTHSDEL